MAESKQSERTWDGGPCDIQPTFDVSSSSDVSGCYVEQAITANLAHSCKEARVQLTDAELNIVSRLLHARLVGRLRRARVVALLLLLIVGDLVLHQYVLIHYLRDTDINALLASFAWPIMTVAHILMLAANPTDQSTHRAS